MRILYLADIRFPLERANGIQTMETCHALAARGHSVVLRVRHNRSAGELDPFRFYGLTRLDSLSVEYAGGVGPAVLQRALFLSTGLVRSLAGGRWDAVVTRDLGAAGALLRIPRGLRPPIAYESHGYAPAVSAALPALLSTGPTASAAKLVRLARRERFVWERADGYVTITHTLARELEARFGPRPVAVVPDGVRLTARPVLQSAAAPRTAPVVGYAGHLYPWKGVDLLIAAIAMTPEVHGLIVGGHPGEPDLDRVRRQAADLGVAGRLRFTGLVPPSDVSALLRETDVLVLPNPDTEISRSYSSPLKLFEYMAAGRPIVASDLPAFREVLSAEEAVLVEPGSASALAAGIRRIIGDRILAERLARNALRAVTAYTWDARAERFERLIEEMTGRSAPESRA